MFCYKIHKSGNDIVLAVCDSEILGKVFKGGKLKLEIKKSFYYEKKAKKSDLSEFFKKATIINLSGKKTIDFAINENLVDKNNTISINGVPHAQIIKL